MTCRDFEGPCDTKLSAKSWDEMMNAVTKHAKENHPDIAKRMEMMSKEESEKWWEGMKMKWDAAPEM